MYQFHINLSFFVKIKNLQKPFKKILTKDFYSFVQFINCIKKKLESFHQW